MTNASPGPAGAASWCIIVSSYIVPESPTGARLGLHRSLPYSLAIDSQSKRYRIRSAGDAMRRLSLPQDTYRDILVSLPEEELGLVHFGPAREGWSGSYLVSLSRPVALPLHDGAWRPANKSPCHLTVGFTRQHKEGLTLYIRGRRADEAAGTVLRSLEEPFKQAKPDLQPEIWARLYQREEVCTHLEDEQAILAGLPRLIKVLQTPNFSFTWSSNDNCLMVHNLRHPEPVGLDRHGRALYVAIDVKWYRFSRQQKKKLEFQARLPQGEWLPDTTWESVVRPMVVKTLTSFLLSCGVASSTISPEMQHRVEHIAPEVDDALLEKFDAVAALPAVLKANYFVRHLRTSYSLPSDAKPVLARIIDTEKKWARFITEFPIIIGRLVRLPDDENVRRGYLEEAVYAPLQVGRTEIYRAVKDARPHSAKRDARQVAWRSPSEVLTGLIDKGIVGARRKGHRTTFRLEEAIVLDYYRKEIGTVPEALTSRVEPDATQVGAGGSNVEIDGTRESGSLGVSLELIDGGLDPRPGVGGRDWLQGGLETRGKLVTSRTWCSAGTPRSISKRTATRPKTLTDRRFQDSSSSAALLTSYNRYSQPVNSRRRGIAGPGLVLACP